MKTYLKGIKTVAVIFLSLLLFSCQDEQIEPIDTLSTDSDQILLKPGKGKGGSVVYYDVFLLSGDQAAGDDLLLTIDGCVATNTSFQPAVSFEEGCDTEFTTSDGTKLFLAQIRLLGSPIEKIQVWMEDIEGNYYSTVQDDDDVQIDPAVTIKPEGYTVSVNKSLQVFKYLKTKRNRPSPSNGYIRIGVIETLPIPSE